MVVCGAADQRASLCVEKWWGQKKIHFLNVMGFLGNAMGGSVCDQSR